MPFHLRYEKRQHLIFIIIRLLYMRNSPQTLACLVNLNMSFNNLYELKFKGKKILEDILNAFWERESMEK